MILQLLLVVGLLLVHLFGGNLRFLDVIPRSGWLSFAGGISVCYVFMHIFPEIEEAQESISEGAELAVFAGQHAYLAALCGLVLFYGLERFVKSEQAEGATAKGMAHNETTTGVGVFWLHVGSFALYNALIGYLLVHREDQTAHGLLLYFVAMALHFLVIDFGLRKDHRSTYDRVGRWVLTGSVFFGWLLGSLTAISAVAVDVLFSLLAGAVTLNVLKEELPEERKSRFLPFIAGATLFAVVLLLG